MGLNVPDYPKAAVKNIQSGLAVGAYCPAFDPLHLSGADKGKSSCPMCRYGYGKGVMVWINHANLDQMSQFVKTMENEMVQRGEKNFRVFIVYMNPFYKDNDAEGFRILQKKPYLISYKQIAGNSSTAASFSHQITGCQYAPSYCLLQ